MAQQGNQRVKSWATKYRGRWGAEWTLQSLQITGLPDIHIRDGSTVTENWLCTESAPMQATEATAPTAPETEATGTEATGAEATGTEAPRAAAEVDASAIGTEATGTEATGTEATGTEATGTEATEAAMEGASSGRGTADRSRSRSPIANW